MFVQGSTFFFGKDSYGRAAGITINKIIVQDILQVPPKWKAKTKIVVLYQPRKSLDGGGFKYLLCSSLLGEMIHFD